MKVNANGNTGQYFRCQFQSARPFGYEAQIETINPEIRPGQLLAAVDKQRDVKGGTRLPASGPGIVYQLAEGNDAAGVERVPADTWFTQEVIVPGNHIVVKFNDKIVVDVVDPNDLFRRGHLALQVFTADHHRSCPSSEGQRTKTRGSAGDQDFVPLFNGKDLTGWVLPEKNSLPKLKTAFWWREKCRYQKTEGLAVPPSAHRPRRLSRFSLSDRGQDRRWGQ